MAMRAEGDTRAFKTVLHYQAICAMLRVRTGM